MGKGREKKPDGHRWWNVFIEHLLYMRPSTKCFTHVISFLPRKQRFRKFKSCSRLQQYQGADVEIEPLLLNLTTNWILAIALSPHTVSQIVQSWNEKTTKNISWKHFIWDLIPSRQSFKKSQMCLEKVTHLFDYNGDNIENGSIGDASIGNISCLFLGRVKALPGEKDTIRGTRMTQFGAKTLPKGRCR